MRTVDYHTGRVTARVHLAAGKVTAVGFVSVPSYLIAAAVPVATSRGTVEAAVSYGGTIYAQVDAAAAGLNVTPEHHRALIALGREVEHDFVVDPDDPLVPGFVPR